MGQDEEAQTEPSLKMHRGADLLTLSEETNQLTGGDEAGCGTDLKIPDVLSPEVGYALPSRYLGHCQVCGNDLPQWMFYT